MHLIWMWPIIMAAVFTAWACANVLTSRVAKDHRLAHLAYVPLLWVGCLGFLTTSPLLTVLSLGVGLPCVGIILAGHLRMRKTKN